MGKVVDTVFMILYFLVVTIGSGYALKTVGTKIKRAALAKAAQELPPLPRFQKAPCLNK